LELTMGGRGQLRGPPFLKWKTLEQMRIRADEESFFVVLLNSDGPVSEWPPLNPRLASSEHFLGRGRPAEMQEYAPAHLVSRRDRPVNPPGGRMGILEKTQRVDL